MKERPILFSGPMVRAILEGRKTQTRRVVKPQPKELKDWAGAALLDSDRCPYGVPGDRLWVRETWLQFADRPKDGDEMPPNACIDYRADYKPAQLRAGVDTDGDPYPAPKWRPSIFMPQWACRLVLEVTDVRVERLQEISELDCEVELGVAPYSLGNAAYQRFHELWDSLNAKRAPWASNPWVWVVEFRPLAAT